MQTQTRNLQPLFTTMAFPPFTCARSFNWWTVAYGEGLLCEGAEADERGDGIRKIVRLKKECSQPLIDLYH